jgi:hypothetical protein
MTCTRKQLITALQALRDLYDHPNHWTKAAWARNTKGQAVVSWNEQAVCWCLAGGVSSVARRFTADSKTLRSAVNDMVKSLMASIRKLYPQLGLDADDTPAIFNDHPDTTIADIRKVIEHAIRTAQEQS